jgi:hypothetical protein
MAASARRVTESAVADWVTAIKRSPAKASAASKLPRGLQRETATLVDVIIPIGPNLFVPLQYC